ncbi:MAG: GNAT family protein [Planctomycetota bacterium]
MSSPRETLHDALGASTRVFVRHPALQDQRSYCELRKSNRDFHSPWEPRPNPGSDPYSPAAFLEVLRTSRTETSERLFLCRVEDGQLLGYFGVSSITRGPLQSAYLGYWIGQEFSRQGYMREGLPLVLDHVFGELGLHRIEANIQPQNHPSISLVRSVGFRREGFSPRYLKIDGRWRDHERWAILADEWRSIRTRD